MWHRIVVADIACDFNIRLVYYYVCFVMLHTGELFIADGRRKEAQFCVQEAGTLFPTSHSVLLQKGRLAELRGNETEAKTLYDEALAINPRGYRILLHLVSDTHRHIQTIHHFDGDQGDIQMWMYNLCTTNSQVSNTRGQGIFVVKLQSYFTVVLEWCLSCVTYMYL